MSSNAGWLSNDKLIYVNLCYRSWFLKHFDSTERLIVNISSLLAIQQFAGWGMYSMAKAGRDALHAVIAKEVDSCFGRLFISARA